MKLILLDVEDDELTPLATINGVTDEVGTVVGVIELEDDTVDITWGRGGEGGEAAVVLVVTDDISAS